MRTSVRSRADFEEWRRAVLPPGALRAADARIRIALLALSWLAFGVRIHGLTSQSLWRDEVDSLRFATRALPELLHRFVTPGENGPFYFLALRPWLAVAGPGEFALRLPSAMAGALAIPAIYVVVRRLSGPAEALIAAFLAATAPYLVWYGQEARMYAALTVLVPLSLWCTLAAAEQGGWRRWGALYLVTSLALYTHILAALVIPVQAGWMLLWPVGSGWRRRLGVVTAYLAALVLPYLPLLRWQAPYLLSAAADPARAPASVGRLTSVLASSFTGGILAPASPALLFPTVLAVLAGVVLWRGASSPSNRAHGRAPLLLLLWLALPVLISIPVSLGLQVLAERYLIWTMPASLALAALGVMALARRWPPLGAALLGIIVALNVVGIAAQTRAPLKSDFRSAAAYVEAHRQPGDILLFQIPYGRYAFTYYHAGLSAAATPACLPVAELWFTGDCGAGGYASPPYIDGPYVSPGEDAASVARRMADALAGKHAVWLVASEERMWDPPSLTRAWLDAHGRVTDRADFTRVSVTRYNLAS
jgi:4-amino-4-deoxy-L-arabinose transferase-like glycosyltransferase